MSQIAFQTHCSPATVQCSLVGSVALEIRFASYQQIDCLMMAEHPLTKFLPDVVHHQSLPGLFLCGPFLYRQMLFPLLQSVCLVLCVSDL